MKKEELIITTAKDILVKLIETGSFQFEKKEPEEVAQRIANSFVFLAEKIEKSISSTQNKM